MCLITYERLKAWADNEEEAKQERTRDATQYLFTVNQT